MISGPHGDPRIEGMFSQAFCMTMHFQQLVWTSLAHPPAVERPSLQPKPEPFAAAAHRHGWGFEQGLSQQVVEDHYIKYILIIQLQCIISKNQYPVANISELRSMSHLAKRKLIFNSAPGRDVSVPRRASVAGPSIAPLRGSLLISQTCRGSKITGSHLAHPLHHRFGPPTRSSRT